jgi:hypothetical protein
LDTFNEKLFTVYGFGLVFIIMGVIMFVFGAQRTADGAWDWQWLSAHSYVLNGPGISMIVFSIVGAMFLVMGYRSEKTELANY